MMIPLRRALIVQQHGILKYPEGTACAEVLKAGASAESRAAASEAAKREQAALGGAATSATTIFTGFGVGLAYKALNVAFKGWKDVPQKIFGAPFAAGSICGGDLAGAARRRLHHRPAHRVDHVRRRRAGVSRADSGRSSSSARAPPRPRSRPARCRSARCRQTRSAAPTSSTSAPARLPPAASSACCVRCRRSGAACRRASRTSGAARPPGTSVIRTERDLSMKVVVFGSLALVVAIMLARAAAHEPRRRRADRRPRLPVRDRVVAADRRNRIVVQSDLGDDRRDAAADVPGLRARRLDRADLLRHRAVDRRHRLHRVVERRHDVAGFEDRLPGRARRRAASRSPSSSARSCRRWCSGRFC